VSRSCTNRCIAAGPLPRTLTFIHCWVHLDEGWTQTVFHDGANVTAIPEETEAYREMACRLGYGTDRKALSREHEVIHTLLAERLRGSASPTLWAVAHPHIACAPVHEQEQEEAVVLAFQSALNGQRRAADLALLMDAIPGGEPQLNALLEEAAALLRPSGQSS
jgi:hypothetical protein